MKLMKSILAISILFLVFVSCSDNQEYIYNISLIEETLISELKGTTIIIRGDNVIYRIKKGDEYESYLFQKSDSLIFKANKTYNINTMNRFQKTMKLMNKYGISSYTSEFENFGIDIKIYLNDGHAIMVVYDTSKLDERYRNYVFDSKKISKKMYLIKELESYD
jgi:hypothetical protein